MSEVSATLVYVPDAVEEWLPGEVIEKTDDGQSTVKVSHPGPCLLSLARSRPQSVGLPARTSHG